MFGLWRLLRTWWQAWRLRRQLRGRWIFPYRDGQRQRWGDPLGIWRAIVHNRQVDVAAAAVLADAGHEPESTQMLDLLAEVFQVERFDTRTARGLTDREVLDLFFQLDAWIEREKKSQPAVERPGGGVRPQRARAPRRPTKKLPPTGRAVGQHRKD